MDEDVFTIFLLFSVWHSSFLFAVVSVKVFVIPSTKARDAD
jgi:hypothetical protein